MEKFFDNKVDLEALLNERDILDNDLTILNSNLKSLIGTTAYSDVDKRQRNQVDDLKNTNTDNDPGRSVNDWSYTLKDTTAEETASLDDDYKESTKQNALKLSSVLVYPYRKQTQLESVANEVKRKAILESQRNNKQVFNRNKRMFGMLMETLKQFKTEESDREELTTKRCKIEEKLDQAVEEERAAIPQQVQKLLQEKEVKEKLLDKAETKLDAITRFRNWENTNRHLCCYIQTESKPKLFWLPKTHNSHTEKRKKETKDYFSLCVAERTAKLRKELEELDSSEETSNLSVEQSVENLALERSR